MTNKYVEAEKRLALVLGWGERNYIQGFTAPDPMPWLEGYRKWIPHWAPQWAQKNGDAFTLMVEHGAYAYIPEKFPQTVEAYCGIGTAVEKLADHRDKETAYRYAIIMAVINKIEGQS